MKPPSANRTYRLLNFVPDPTVVRLLPEKTARECLAVPLRAENGDLIVATVNANDPRSLHRLASAAKRPVRPLTVTYPVVREALDAAYGASAVYEPEPVDEALCLRMGYIQAEHLPAIQRKMSRTSLSFLDACEALGLIDPQDLTEARAILHRIPYLREKTLGSLLDLSELVPWEIASEWKVVPLCWVRNHLVIGSPRPCSRSRMNEVARLIGLPVQYVLLAEHTWEKLYRRFYLRGKIEPDHDQVVAKLLVRQGKISEANLQDALAVQAQAQKPLERVLFDLNLIARKEWFQAKAKYFQTTYQEVARPAAFETRASNDLPRPIPLSIIKAMGVLPLQIGRNHCLVGMTQPTQKRIRFIEQLTGVPVEVRLVDREQVEAYLLSAGSNEKMSPGDHLPTIEEYAVQLGLVSGLLDQTVGAREPAATGVVGTGDALVSAGLIDELVFTELAGLSSDQPYSSLARARFTASQIQEVPPELIARHHCLPLFSGKQELWLAVADPLDGNAIREVERSTGKRVWPVVAPRTVIQSVIQRYVVPQVITSQKEYVNLLEKLVENGHITQFDAARALEIARNEKKPFDLALVETGALNHSELPRAVAGVLGLEAVSLAIEEKETLMIGPTGEMIKKTTAFDPVEIDAARLIDLETAQRWDALPVKKTAAGLVVAFADPTYHMAMQQLQAVTGLPIIPVLASRPQLEEAIQRTLGQRNLGTALLLAGLVTRKQLNRALDLARRTGVRLGQALVNRRIISTTQLYQFLADQSGLPFLEDAAAVIDEKTARRIPAETARRYGILPIQENSDGVIVGLIDPLDNHALVLAKDLLQQPVTAVLITDRDFDRALEKIYSREYLQESVSNLLERAPQDSAYRVLSSGQAIFLIVFLVLSAAWIFFHHLSYFIVLNVLATIFYLAFSAYKLFLIYGALNRNLEVPVTDEEIKNLKDSELPVYSILIPVYHEAEVLPDLLNAIDRFDYPSTKLDILVLMEEDDRETIDAFHAWDPPSHFQGIVVPAAQPKTKPKACNYGLIHARGEYVVIYDAEDLPDPDQLKKAIVAFNKVDEDVVCIQSKLNYYNSGQNLLTRFFTIEYSMWFDLFLPGLVASGAPVPLGGTSNHFRRDALIECGAWDPYNVTEDADLGIRLYKRGYQTAVIDSTTFEEANSKLNNWIRQRSRWIKGYIQTWLVHMRNPVKLWNEIGWKAFLGFQFTVGGTFFSALINPLYWSMTTLWYLLKWQFIQELFPPVIFYLGAICLLLGNFAFTYINVAGALRRGHYDMVKYALISPFYWALASIAAWRGFLQLIRNPFYWEKTIHGLHNGNGTNGDQVSTGEV